VAISRHLASESIIGCQNPEPLDVVPMDVVDMKEDLRAK
jgi:hypothetical protein